MNQKKRANWERVKAKGMWRFVLLYGILIWGGSMLIAFSAYRFLVRGLRFLDELSFLVPIFLVSGFAFGVICWLVGEHKHRKSSSDAS